MSTNKATPASPGAVSPTARKIFLWALGTIAVLLVVQGIKGVVREWKASTAASTTAKEPELTKCEDGSDKEVRLCPIGKGGSKPLKSEDSVPSGIRLCYEPEEGVRAERWIEKVGGKPRSFFRFVSTTGDFVVVRYKFKESCQGPL